jgi:hypothetical protein
VDNVEQRWITVTDIAVKLDISCGYAFHHLQPWISQNLCKVIAKAAYRLAQTGTCENVRATFAVIS